MPAPSAALCLHGRVSSWHGSATPKDWPQALVNRSRRSLARFAADSLRRHVVLASMRAGLHVPVYIHLWNPELREVLDAQLTPAASTYEPVIPGLRALRSMHLSMERVLALVPASVSLVMVSRADLLLFSDAPLASLAAAVRGPSLWLPHTCMPHRRLPPRVQCGSNPRVPLRRRRCNGSCMLSDGVGSPRTASPRAPPEHLAATAVKAILRSCGCGSVMSVRSSRSIERGA
jgi:hypothetical protein